MSKIDGGPAFPAQVTEIRKGPDGGDFYYVDCRAGMFLLDWFAGHALSGILADPTTVRGGETEDGRFGWPDDEYEFRAAVAETAYEHARAMLAARKGATP